MTKTYNITVKNGTFFKLRVWLAGKLLYVRYKMEKQYADRSKMQTL